MLDEGIQEAAFRGKSIHIGLEKKMIINQDPFQRICLSQNQYGQTDISPLLALGAEENPEIAKRYCVYSRLLERMNRN